MNAHQLYTIPVMSDNSRTLYTQDTIEDEFTLQRISYCTYFFSDSDAETEFEDLSNLESSDEWKIWMLKIDQEKWAKAAEDAEYLSEKHPEITFNNFYFFKPTGSTQLPQKVPYVPWPKALFNQYMELIGNDVSREYDEAAYIKFCCVRRWLKREQQRQIDMGRIVVEKAVIKNLKITRDEKDKKLYSFDYTGRRRCLIPGSPPLKHHSA